jgi:excisionase family DNA binding protein
MESLIGISELAQYLGVKTSTVYDWVHTRQISFYKVGRLVKFRRTEVERWLEKRRVSFRP